jgi:Flp pilus assembly protein TadG
MSAQSNSRNPRRGRIRAPGWLTVAFSRLRIAFGNSPESESGQVIILAATAMTVLFAICGLALDVGYFYNVQRNMQTAADAAAMAGDTAARWGQNYSAAAKAAASLNGFTDGQNGVTVTVNNPPQSGNYTASNGYTASSGFFEAKISVAEPTYFMRVLGRNTMNIAARAVAGPVNSKTCIVILDPHGSGSLNSVGALTSTCGIVVNSDSSTALQASGSVTAPSIGIVGKSSGYTGTLSSPIIRTGVAPLPDPMGYLSPPSTVGSCTATNYNKSSGTYTLIPGIYCGGITASGTATLNLNAGTYILMGGGLNSVGNSTINGTSVTFYNTGDATYAYKPIYCQDSNVLNLTAPTSGSLAGVLMFQDRSQTANVTNVVGGGTSSIVGALYFPNSTVSLSSQTMVSSAYNFVIAYDLSVQIDRYNVGNNFSFSGPVKVTALYE